MGMIEMVSSLRNAAMSVVKSEAPVVIEGVQRARMDSFPAQQLAAPRPAGRLIGSDAVPAHFSLCAAQHVREIVSFAELFRDTKELNAGASAVCLSAVHRMTGEKVALKVFRPGKDRFGKHKPYSRSCFLEETEIAVRCRGHPNVIWTSLPAYRSQREGYVLVSEYANGSDLLDYFNEQKGQLCQDDVMAILRQMVAGLQHVHSRGYIHMDVKPENFVVQTTPGGATTVKLIDFGLAYRIGRTLPRRMSTCGGRVYYAPEKFPRKTAARLLHGDKYFTTLPSFDVWGLGVTILSCMTHRMPWEVAYDGDDGYTRFKSFAEHPECFTSPPTPFCYLSDKWVGIFKRIFVEDASQRMTLEEVKSLLDNETEGFMHPDITVMPLRRRL